MLQLDNAAVRPGFRFRRRLARDGAGARSLFLASPNPRNFAVNLRVFVNEDSFASRATGAVLHVEVMDEFGPYRAANTVTVTDMSGHPLVTLDCDGPRANFQVAPGSHRVVASIDQMRSQDVTVDVPRGGTGVTVQLPPEPGRAGELP